MIAWDASLQVLVIVGFLIAFLLAFGIGANDVANSFGTSVGSKVLSLRHACMLASVFEILGAILLGGKVSETIREGIIDPNLFKGEEKEYCLGLVSTLCGCCLWMLVATFFKLPVSGTHSIVGSTMGFALVARGPGAIHWKHFIKIVASWFISPLLSGVISVIAYLFIRRFILFPREKQLQQGLNWLPLFYSGTILINVLSVLLSGPSLFYFDRIPLWSKLFIVVLVGVITALIVKFFVCPHIKKKIQKSAKGCDEEKTTSPSVKKSLLDSLFHDGPQTPSQSDMTAVAGHESFAVCSGVRRSDLGQPPHAEICELSVSVGEKTRLYTVERGQDKHDKGIQADYVTLLNDIPVMLSYAERYGPTAYDLNTRLDYAESERIHTVPFGNRIEFDQRSWTGGRRVNFASSVADPVEYARGTSDAKSLRSVGPHLRDLMIGGGGLDVTDAHSSFSYPGRRRSVLSAHHIPLRAMPVVSCDIDGDEEDVDEIVQKVQQRADADRKKVKRDDHIEDTPEASKLFSFLQILTAVFGSFAHGGNDVSNAIGPLISLWLVYAEGTVKSSKTPLWVLFYGGVGIIFGLWLWGRRVMKTIGEDLTKITPSAGFVIEVSTAFTVLFASNLSIPVSTTHCKVGSVVFTGRVRSKESVDWSLFGNIIIAWLVTVPVTGVISAALMALFRSSVLNSR